MVKSRGAERERDREREPARERHASSQRKSGMGLSQVGLFCTLGAVAFAVLGAWGAAQSAGGAVAAEADNTGAALVAALSAPDAHSWAENHDTFEYMSKRVRERYSKEAQEAWPKLDKATYEKIVGDDYRTKERNKARLRAVEAASPVGRGALRGLQVRFSDKDIPDQSVGARLGPGVGLSNGSNMQGSDVIVGTATAEIVGGGAVKARVYRRAIRSADGREVGEALAIFSQAALDSAGSAGMWIFLAPLLVGLAAAGFLLAANRTASGLHSVVHDLETIGRGKLDARVTTSAGGEVGQVQRALEKAIKNIQLIQTTGSGNLDEAVEKELSMAAQIHQSLRPQDPPRISGYEIETLFKPGRDIGGDYFDYVDIDGNRMVLLIADCAETLRGVPAAMVMAMTRAYLKSAIDPATGPADWLKATNRRLARDLRSGVAITAQILVLDKGSGEIVCASAGHKPLIFWRQGKTATVNPNGIALGLDIGPVFDKTLEEKKLTLQANDRVVVYTDGVITAKNGEGAPYGDTAFLESVRKQGGMNSAAFVNFAAGNVDRHLAGEEQDDDITISTIKRLK